MEVRRIELGSWGVNCYLAWCPQTKEALVIDPGAEPDEVATLLDSLGLKPVLIVNTHGHLDHIGGNRRLSELYGCPIAISLPDSEMLTDASKNLSAQLGEPITSPAASRLLQDGDELIFGSCRLRIISTPGHSQGSICLFAPDILFAGDTLFAGSIGRSDLPGGNQSQLIRVIKERLLSLPAPTRVLPGHGPETTIGAEAQDNPWLQG